MRRIERVSSLNRQPRKTENPYTSRLASHVLHLASYTSRLTSQRLTPHTPHLTLPLKNISGQSAIKCLQSNVLYSVKIEHRNWSPSIRLHEIWSLFSCFCIITRWKDSTWRFENRNLTVTNLRPLSLLFARVGGRRKTTTRWGFTLGIFVGITML